jgi:hypothetical protein
LLSRSTFPIADESPPRGKEKHTGLVAYELTALMIDWLQELVGEEGATLRFLKIFRLPISIWREDGRRILQARTTGPLSREASDHALKVQELFSEGLDQWSTPRRC